MKRFEIDLLGRFQVRVDGRPVSVDAWRHRRGSDLVKWLALYPNHRANRDQVIDALWPDLPPEAGQANLYKAAHHARRALGEAGAIVVRGGQVALAPQADLDIDAERFEADGDPSLYRGELLPDDRYTEWTAEPRERLRRLYLDRLRAAGAWERVVEEEPTDEDAQRRLMSRYAKAGDRHAALRQFQQAQAALAQIGLQPSEETVALHEELSRGPPAVARVPQAPPILGRDAELRRARAVIERASQRSGGAILIRGDAGIGKTRFCDELLSEAENRGWTTLRGTAWEGESSAPYAPIVEALDGLLLERPDLAAGLTEGAQAELSRLTTAFPGPRQEAQERPDRQRVFAAVGQLVAAAAGERGALLVVEDLHAADRATPQLLHYLTRTARAQALVVLISYRSRQLFPALARTRSALLEQRIAAEIALGPLKDRAARAIVERSAEAPLPPETVEAITELAAGNPFFLEELAAATAPDGGLDVPDRLVEIIDGRISRLEPELAAVLARVAVAGREFSSVEFVAMSGLDEASAHSKIDSALSVGLIEEAEGDFRFRHALVREALARSLSAHRRAEAHREAARQLEEAGADPARIASHLASGGRPQEAVPWFTRAARGAASVAAYAVGLSFAEQALTYANEPEQPELLTLRAELMLATGDPSAALAFGEALTLAPEAERLGLRVRQARAYLVAGKIEAAAKALQNLEPKTENERARLRLTEGIIAWFSGNLDKARHAAEEAESLLLVHGTRAELLEVNQLRGVIAHSDGTWQGRLHLQLQGTSGDPELAAMVFDGNLCTTEYILTSDEPNDDLTNFAHELERTAERAGALRGQAFAATVLGEIELQSGDVEDAQSHLEAAVGLNRAVGAAGGEALARLRLGESYLAQGRLEQGKRRLEEALELARWSPIGPSHLLYMIYAAMVRTSPEPDDALAIVDRAESVLDPGPSCSFCPGGYYIAATIACARVGNFKRARSFYERAERIAGRWPSGPWAPGLAEAHAALAQLEGDAETALTYLREAADGFARTGQLLHEARVRAVLDSPS